MTEDEFTRLIAGEEDEAELAEMPQRPRCRSECIDADRPCPWVGCKFHLWCDVSRVGTLIVGRLEVPPWEMEESCALDLADRGKQTLETIARSIGVSKERARQIAEQSVRKIKVAAKRNRDLEATAREVEVLK